MPVPPYGHQFQRFLFTHADVLSVVNKQGRDHGARKDFLLFGDPVRQAGRFEQCIPLVPPRDQVRIRLPDLRSHHIITEIDIRPGGPDGFFDRCPGFFRPHCRAGHLRNYDIVAALIARKSGIFRRLHLILIQHVQIIHPGAKRIFIIGSDQVDLIFLCPEQSDDPCKRILPAKAFYRVRSVCHFKRERSAVDGHNIILRPPDCQHVSGCNILELLKYNETMKYSATTPITAPMQSL